MSSVFVEAHRSTARSSDVARRFVEFVRQPRIRGLREGMQTMDGSGGAGYARPMSTTPVWGSRNAALAALGLNVVVLGTITLIVATLDLVPDGVSDTLADFSQTLARISTLGIWIGALGFLPWLNATYARARAVAPSRALEEQWRIGPIAGWFIPFLNLVRPYRAVRVLDEALDPDEVPAPPPRIADAGATYRVAPPLVLPERRTAKSAPVTVWWALWLGRMASGFVFAKLSPHPSNLVTALHDLVLFSAAVAAWLVVWRISARLAEVERRRAALA